MEKHNNPSERYAVVLRKDERWVYDGASGFALDGDFTYADKSEADEDASLLVSAEYDVIVRAAKAWRAKK